MNEPDITGKIYTEFTESPSNMALENSMSVISI